ncbi:MAG: orotate phosphoribosyltransferase [Bacteroidales bacterium]|jgi:orotate phosphoribosyltransferase|nr:orotate phosphoribosyltransferase [Bacteroidales bacterium]
MMNKEEIIAQKLLQIKAIKLNPTNHFTWASGWNSPIYCDNRKTLSYPEVRTTICDSFVERIKELYPEVEVIAGVATGAIAQGVLVAQQMDIPFIYVRSSAKGHGLENLVEGEVKPGSKVVVIEDLVSTGGSSLKAVEALRERGCEVLGMMAIFTYGFDIATENFKKHNVKLDTLSNYHTLIDLACKDDYIKDEDINTLKEWREAPDKWKK